MLVGYIDAHRERFGVEPICEVLRKAGTKIAPSSYYAAKTRPPSARAIADGQRLEVIRRVHEENYGVYGVCKIHAELNRRGHRIARCTVHRLMRAVSQVPQVVAVGADRVRAVSRVEQVREEPADRRHFVAVVVDQYDAADDATLSLLDHPHTGLPRRYSAHQAAALPMWRSPYRRVEITENSATMASTLNITLPTASVGS